MIKYSLNYSYSPHTLDDKDIYIIVIISDYMTALVTSDLKPEATFAKSGGTCKMRRVNTIETRSIKAQDANTYGNARMAL